jgi:hypothetical protein
MKKVDSLDDDLRSEYHRDDFGELERGKYAERTRKSSNVIILAPDVADVFPDAEAVNQALR